MPGLRNSENIYDFMVDITAIYKHSYRKGWNQSLVNSNKPELKTFFNDISTQPCHYTVLLCWKVVIFDLTSCKGNKQFLIPQSIYYTIWDRY